jgi:molybdopterin synthase catalytic subunit
MSREGKEIESGIYQKGEVDFPMIIEGIKTNKEIKKAGSILSFNGIVRETSKDGQPVESLTIDAYTELANKSIDKICMDIKQIDGIIDIKIIHLKGEFNISEDLVYVVVASTHRDEGFKALRKAVERYKSEIEVWKREELVDGSSEWTH